MELMYIHTMNFYQDKSVKIWNYETENNYGEWDEPGPADVSHFSLLHADPSFEFLDQCV